MKIFEYLTCFFDWRKVNFVIGRFYPPILKPQWLVSLGILGHTIIHNRGYTDELVVY